VVKRPPDSEQVSGLIGAANPSVIGTAQGSSYTSNNAVPLWPSALLIWAE
jgi:hypothetical protein